MTAPRRPSPRTIVGWREWIALPELGIAAIKPKIDTGARSSSLHAFNIETFDRDGAAWVRFDVHPLQRNSSVTVRAEAPVLEFRHIRSSSGHQTLRPVIRTDVELGGRRWPVEITLAARDEMGFRMLLGREAVRATVCRRPRAVVSCQHVAAAESIWEEGNQEEERRDQRSAASADRPSARLRPDASAVWLTADQLIADPTEQSMRIAILSRRPSLYSTQRLKEAGEQRGHEMTVVDYLRCYMDITSHRPQVIYQGEPLQVDAIIPRIGASNTFYGTAVVRQFEMMGVFVANESQAISRSRDKLRSLQLLARDGVGLPVTGLRPLDQGHRRR